MQHYKIFAQKNNHFRLYGVTSTTGRLQCVWASVLLTCQSPLPGAVRVSAVVQHVGVVARAVGRRPLLQEPVQLGLHGLQAQPAGGVVAAEVLDHVVGEEELHLVQHVRGALVELLHLVRGQQHGLAVEAGWEWDGGGGETVS